MNRLRIFSILLLVVGALGAADTTLGWRGDGTGYFPDATPPTKWGDGKGIAWKVELPSFGHAAPVVVGDVVVATSDPYDLVAVSIASGEIAWKATVDQFALMPEDQAEAGRALVAEERALYEALYAWAEKVGALRDKLKEAGLKELTKGKAWSKAFEDGEVNEADLPDDPTLAAEWKALAKEGGERGFQYKKTGNDLEREDHAGNRERTQRLGNEFAEWYESRERGWNQVTGANFATPVSDGERVYVSYANNVVACFDAQGEQQWAVWDHKPRQGKGVNTRRELHYTASPVLAGGLVIVAADADRIRAYDQATGEKRWESAYPARGKNLAGTPAVMELDQGPVVIAANGHVYRVADGAILADDLPPCGGGASPVARDNRVVMLPGRKYKGDHKGMVMCAITAAGDDAVKWEPVWSVSDPADTSRAPAWHGDLLYHLRKSGKKPTLAVYQANDGKVVHENAIELKGNHLSISVVGDYLVTKDTSNTMRVITTGRDPELVATNELDHDRRAGNYSLPCFAGSRIFVRSNDHLHCIAGE